MKPRLSLSPPPAAWAVAFAFAPTALSARELLVDKRGGAAYATLASAASAAAAGDTIVLAKGSGPYREELRINASGTASAPIVVEGNGETVTGFDPITFTTTNGVSTYRLATGVFSSVPVVLSWRGRRIPQDQATGAFLGPVSLLADDRTLQLDPGTPTDGWEVSTRLYAVALNNVSHHLYRNLVATGTRNDGFNLHGAGTGLVFENIAAHSNLDEGFSSHETIVCTLRGARFWANDNGIGNINSTVMAASDVLIHDNLGFGLWLTDDTLSTLSNIRCWNNGVAQIRFELRAAGSADQVRAWTPPWSTPPWRRHNEAKNATTSIGLGNIAAQPPPIPRWSGAPQLVASPAAPAVINPRAGVAVPSAAALISAAVAAKNPLVVLPAGTHSLTDTITISDASNLVIDGTGATLSMTNRRRAILALHRADGVSLKGLALDYDPPPFTQGMITAATPDLISFTVHDGYPDLSADLAGAPVHLFKPDGSRHPQAYDFYIPALTLASSRSGTLAANGTRWPASLAVGDLLAIDRRNIDATNAVEIRDNTGPVSFQDLTVLASPALGFAGRYCLAPVSFERVTVRPGPRPAGATRDRLLSTNADTLNFVQCRRGPLVADSEFSRQGDDGLNVHGYLFQISRVLSPASFEFTYPGPAAGFLNPARAGDTVRLQAPGNFSILGSGVLASAATLSTVDNLTTYRVTLAEPPSAPLAAGRWFDIPELNSPGYVVRDSWFHDHRGRGLRLMGDDGLVERNRFERLTKSGISIGPELGQWREAGWVRNVTVRDNVLRSIGVDLSLSSNGSVAPGAISVFAHTDGDAPPHPALNRAIRIIGNTVSQSSVAGIHAYAVDGLFLRDNVLEQTNLLRGPGTDPVTGLVTTGPLSVSAAVVWNQLQEWRDRSFGTALSAGPAADNADADGDGIANLLEYAFGLDPVALDGPAPTSFATDSEGRLSFTFFRARADLAYTVSASSDLVNWTPLATNPGSVGQDVTVTDTPPAGSPRRFLRLGVTTP